MRATPLALGLALAASPSLAACSASPEPPPVAVASIAAPALSPAPQGPAEPSQPGPERREQALICQGRSPCRITSSSEAGGDSSGNHLTVIEATLAEAREGGEGPAEVDGARGCDPIEHWLVTDRAGQPPSARLLLASCNDGYGAAGVGDDEVEIKPGVFRHGRSGGSSWRWSVTTELSLSPLAITSVEHAGSWTLGPNAETSRWSFSTFSGETRWFSPPCGPGGEPDWPSDREPDWRAFVALPLVDLDEPFARDGWRAASLGACAARVDASGDAGFVVKGQPGAAGDARLRAVASAGHQLFVEIDDDRWVTGQGPVARQDHLELWWSARASGYGDHCLDKAGGKPSVALVRLTDGKVFPVGKAPAAALPSAEIAAPASPGRPLRLKVDLPPGLEALTLAYADVDRPGVVERAIATSELRPGEAASLGRLRAVAPREAGCALEGGRLEPVRHAPPEGEAVISEP